MDTAHVLFQPFIIHVLIDNTEKLKSPSVCSASNKKISSCSLKILIPILIIIMQFIVHFILYICNISRYVQVLCITQISRLASLRHTLILIFSNFVKPHECLLNCTIKLCLMLYGCICIRNIEKFCTYVTCMCYIILHVLQLSNCRTAGKNLKIRKNIFFL